MVMAEKAQHGCGKCEGQGKGKQTRSSEECSLMHKLMATHRALNTKQLSFFLFLINEKSQKAFEQRVV